MVNFEYVFPTRVFFGPGQLVNVAKQLKRFPKRVFIVLGDDTVERAGHLKKLLDVLSAIGIESSIFRKVESRLSVIEKAAKEAKGFGARFIIAFGNSEVIDAAKCINTALQGDGGMSDYIGKGTSKKKKTPAGVLPLIAIPTVSTSTTHCSATAGVTSKKERFILESEGLFPRMTFIDPEFCELTPPQYVAGAGIVMMANVLEEYFSGVAEAPLQDRFAIAIVRTIVEYLPRVLRNTKDEAAHSQLFWVSTEVGSNVLIGREGQTPIRAIDACINGHLKLPHGKGMAVLLPAMMRYDLPLVSNKIVTLGREVFGLNMTGNLETDATATIRAFEVFIESMGFSPQIDRAAFEKNPDDVLSAVLNDVLDIYGDESKVLQNIRPIDRKALEGILRSAINEKV